MKDINLIAAIQKKDRGLGLGSELLFWIKDDLRNFKEKTSGATVIMGRKTFDSLPGRKPLPKRTNIVITRNPELSVPEGVILANSLDDALTKATKLEAEIFVLGGGEIYAQALAKATRLHLTVVEADKPANVFFPEYDDFKKVAFEEKHFDEATQLPYTFLVLEK